MNAYIKDARVPTKTPRQKRAAARSGAAAPLPVVHDHGPEAEGGPSLLSPDDARHPAPGGDPPNAGRGPEDGQRGNRAAGRAETGGENTHSRPEESTGGPEAKGEGRPKCGSHTATEGVDTESIPTSEILLPLVADIHTNAEDIPPLSENSESDSLLPTPIVDQPSFGNTASPVPAWVGRDENGHCIKHVYDIVVAQKIAEWVSLGANENDMAICLNMRPGKLRELYFRELATGKFNNDMQVGNSILTLAKAGVPQMAIFYAKARMGWSDKDKSDQNGDGLLNIHIHT